MGEALDHRLFAPGGGFHRYLDLAALVLVRDLEQSLRAVRAPVEYHVLDALAQLVGQVVIDRQATGVDDAHVHAGTDRVEQEDRMDGLTHRVVAAERKRDIGYAAGDMRRREALFQLAR